MAKINPYQLAERAADVVTRTISDPSNPGLDIKLTLRRLNRIEVGAAIERGQELVCKHVTGFGDPGEDGFIPPTFLPPVGGQAVIFGGEAAYLATAIALAQVSDDPYTATEILSFMAYDGYQDGITKLMGDVAPKALPKPDPTPQTA
jgi:hypothetical protein